MFMPYANNKSVDQTAHLCSLISTFVVCCLDSIISLVSISEISSLYLASFCGCEGLFVSYQVTNLKDTFSHGMVHLLNQWYWNESNLMGLMLVAFI